MEKGNDKIGEDLATRQKTIEIAAGEVAHHTKAERATHSLSTPENVRSREEAAARCTAKIKRKVLKEQARKASAEHLVKCCLETVKKKTKRKPLTELYVKGYFTEDRKEWQQELRRHCDEVYTDQEETNEIHQDRIDYFKKRGDRHFTVEGIFAEVTHDLVVQARAKTPYGVKCRRAFL